MTYIKTEDKMRYLYFFLSVFYLDVSHLSGALYVFPDEYYVLIYVQFADEMKFAGLCVVFRPVRA